MTQITEILEAGVKAHTQGDLQSAVKAYQSAIELDATNATAHNNLGFVLGQLTQWQQAKFHLEEAIRLDNQLAIAYANFGQILAAMGDAQQGIANLQQALKLEPENADHWNNLARILFAANQFENAEYAWHRALSLDASNVEFMTKMATTMVAQQRYSEAQHMFDCAIQLNANYQEAWAQKGVALFLEQNYGDCKKCLHKALELNPDDYTALKHLSLVHIACGENLQAIDYMYSLNQKYPEEVSVACDLAVLELSIGEKESARERLRMLREQSKGSKLTYYYAVSLKETGGDFKLIKSLLQEIIDREGDEYRDRALESMQALTAN